MLSAKKTLTLGKKQIKQLVKKPVPDPDGEKNRWFKDNARLLLSCIENGLLSLKKNNGRGADDFFYRLKTALSGVNCGNTEPSFVKAVGKDGVETELCELFAPLTFAAAAVRALEAYENGTESFSSAVKLIFAMKSVDFDSILPEVCAGERLLMLDPSGDYPKCDRLTKKHFRDLACGEAKKRGETAQEYIKASLEKAENAAGEKRHIGFQIGEYKTDKSAGVSYICVEAAFTAAAAFVTAFFCTRPVSGFFNEWYGIFILTVLLFLPFYAALRPISDRLAAHFFKPAFLASYDPELTDELPSAVIAVSSVLPTADRINTVKEHLRETKLSDSSPDTVLVYLCDLKNAAIPLLPEDETDIRASKNMIDSLNRECGGGFVLALRDRVFAPSENSYGGHERKRGALCALVKYITDGDNAFSVLHGDTGALKKAKYMLALDSDTTLPFESLKKLVCIASYPLNRPVFSPEKRRITQGYGIIAPRVETTPSSAEKTIFSSFMTLGGISAYSSPVSERYMDMFGVSLFTGKGLIDIEAFSQVCVDAFPDGLILSHDIPEGSLMNTAFAGGVCLTDSFPSKPSAYRKREHRWIRGDIQNLRLLHGTTNGSPASPEITMLTKYQLLDNLRRALSPAVSLACLILSLFCKGGVSKALFAAAFLSVISEPAVSFLYEILRLGLKALASVYLTSSAGVGLKSLIRAVYLTAALPEQTALSVSAALKGFYRGFISHKKTLEWTTAADGERGRSGIPQSVFSAAAAAVLLIFGTPLHRLWGVLVLFNIPFSFSDGIPNAKTAESLSAAQRETLKSYAAAEWRYFEKYVTAEENYLPPDNVQFTPVKRTAHRTSPTDIGMYLMSCLTASDLSLITEDELAERLKNTVTTLKKMPRCLGLLYNWYDTRTLEVLQPDFVSTVDCGNYLCCIAALGEGLRKLSDNARFGEIISFLDSEITSSDLGVLYSKKRGLFSVGMNGSDKSLSPSFYDTYMSEMRLTSYFASAMREVPPSHNERLSRASVSSGVYTSAASWTGTAFEYLMPTLFLPVFDNTFLSEALYNCIREQKKFSRRTSMPWGVSESGYYAFDAELNYRYKAHGIHRLAIKADADCEKVFSPYSSFLSLAISPDDAMKNLARFVLLGAFGACGFYEALDFTPIRVSPEKYMAVRSFMAHHKGMSLIACGNALFDNINVRRFASNAKMKAAESLLNEKLPPEAPFSARLPKRKDDDKKRFNIRSESSALTKSVCALFSDRDSALLCTENGRNIFVYSALSVFASRKCATGLFAAVRTAEETVPLSGVDGGELKQTNYFFRKKTEYGIFEHALCLSGSTAGVFAPVKITNDTGEERIYELFFYAEPELLPVGIGNGHKSYSDMFIRAEENRNLSAVTFERRENGKIRAAVALGFADGEPFVFTCKRSRVLNAAENAPYPFYNRVPEFTNETFDVSPCLAASVTMRLSSGEKREKVLVAAVGDDKADALNKLSVIRSRTLQKTDGAAHNIIEFSPGVKRVCEKYLLSRYFHGAPDRVTADAVEKNDRSVNLLWEKGISGDNGIIRVTADDAPVSLYADFIKFHSMLTKTGLTADLVFTLCSPDDYTSSASEKVRGVIKKMHAESFLGAHGGIHIINTGAGSPVDILLTAAANAVFPDGTDNEKIEENTHSAAVYKRSGRAVSGSDGFLPDGYFINRQHSFSMSHTLSNGVMGTLLTDTSLGFTFFANARLCPLTPPPVDTSEPMTGEMLTLEAADVRTDCINGASVFFRTGSALYRADADGVKCDTSVAVAKRGAVKNISVKLTGLKKRCSLVYSLVPVMNEKTDFARFCKVELTTNGAVVYNPFNTDYGGYMYIFCPDCTPEREENGRLRFRVSLTENTGHFETSFRLVFSSSRKGLLPLSEMPFVPMTEKSVQLRTGSSEFDRFANALLYHQAADTRIKARTGFYQCSGAYGFRDQLQDAMCTVRFDPTATARIILLCAAAQFCEGDVLHWFHLIPGVGKKGVRTRCSDDMLWLPFAACVYVKETGNTEIFKTEIPFLEGEVLKKDENKRYSLYRKSLRRGTLYEHCMNSIFKACEFGTHGLPLIKDGDWNDSFDEIGKLGKGESVWLAMFLKLVCDKMLPYTHAFGKKEHEELLIKISQSMEKNVMRSAYNGEFFTRAFFDDGEPLGSGSQGACRIDLLPQSFAVFAGIGTHEQREKALLAAFGELVDSDSRIIKLFTPPFDEKSRRAGYVNDYPEGVRENGGQYTHAAVWFALALLKEGLIKEAAAATGFLLPSLKGKNYEREPYAMCGDVYSAPGAEGKGGWSLYTGAAGWMLVLALEWEKYSKKEEQNGKINNT